MKNEEEINREIENIVKSIDRIKRAEGAPYLLTRINARLNLQTKTIWENIAVFICRPAVMGLGLFFLLLINSIVIISQGSQKATIISEKTTSALAEEEEYSAVYTTFYNTETP